MTSLGVNIQHVIRLHHVVMMNGFKYMTLLVRVHILEHDSIFLSLSLSTSLYLSLPLSTSLHLSLPLSLFPPLSFSIPKQFVMIICLKMKNSSFDFERMTVPTRSLLTQQLLQRASEYTAGKSMPCSMPYIVRDLFGGRGSYMIILYCRCPILHMC